jgi:cysteine synthase
VKGIYDKCWELKRDPANVIFNQFEEFGNPIFHYNVTGPAIEEVFGGLGDDRLRAAAYVSATGSAGTIAAGDFLKTRHPGLKIVAAEALQCPTLLQNGFGAHRIEGIGDKHVPWVHNVRNTDAVAAIDDEDCMRIVGCSTNPPVGSPRLAGVATNSLAAALVGISGVCNLLAAIKTAKYFDLRRARRDLHRVHGLDAALPSRLAELRRSTAPTRAKAAVADFAGPIAHQSPRCTSRSSPTSDGRPSTT